MFLAVIAMGLIYSKGAYGQITTDKIQYLDTIETPETINSYSEILEKRTTNTQTFTNGTDSFIKIYVGDKFVEKDGQLLPFVDTSKIQTEQVPVVETPSKSVFQDIMGLFETKIAWATLSATLSVDSGKDTNIISDDANSNFGTLDTRGVVEWTANSRHIHALIGATLPAQPTASATITKIELKMYKTDNAGYTNDTTEYNEAHMLTRQDWTETGATWNNYKSGSAWSAAGGDFESTYLSRNQVGTDTGVWRNWVLYGTGTNHDYDNPTWGATLSVLLKLSSVTPSTNTAEVFAMKEYATSTLRPYFVVYYDYPEPTPTPTPTPTPEPDELSTASVPLLRGINTSLILLLVIGIFDLMRRIFIKK